MTEEHEQILEELFTSGKLFAPISETESAPDLKPLWGNWIFRKAIVEEVGEPGISKTSFNYIFAASLLNRKKFLGVEGKYNEIDHILYIDLESDDTLIKARRHLLELEDNPKFLKCNLPNVTLYELEPYIDRLLEGKRVTIIFIDPLRAAFNTRDENDNAEASKQMKYLRYLTQKWNCAIILVHHSSKAEHVGTKKGSGAYARVALADINWNFEKLGDDYPPELFKFSIPKCRQIQDDLCLCVKKEGGLFEEVEFPLGYQVAEAGIRIYSLQQAIDIVMEDKKERAPAEILKMTDAATGKEYSMTAVFKALSALIQLGVIKRAGYGKYVHT